MTELKSLIEVYAEAKATIKEAEATVKELQPLIKEHVELDVAYEVGNATVTLKPGKTRWEFSPAVKELQEVEKLNGSAKEVQGEPFLDCRFKKS